MKTLVQYLREHPEAEKYRARLTHDLEGVWEHATTCGERFILSGLIQFTPDSGCGGFPGDYLVFRLVDDSATTFKIESHERVVEANTRWFVDHPDEIVNRVTVEKPVRLHVWGRGNAVWCKTYPDVFQALGELQIFEVTQPLDFDEFIEFGFVSTG